MCGVVWSGVERLLCCTHAPVPRPNMTLCIVSQWTPAGRATKKAVTARCKAGATSWYTVSVGTGVWTTVVTLSIISNTLSLLSVSLNEWGMCLWGLQDGSTIGHWSTLVRCFVFVGTHHIGSIGLFSSIKVQYSIRVSVRTGARIPQHRWHIPLKMGESFVYYSTTALPGTERWGLTDTWLWTGSRLSWWIRGWWWVLHPVVFPSSSPAPGNGSRPADTGGADTPENWPTVEGSQGNMFHYTLETLKGISNRLYDFQSF